MADQQIKVNILTVQPSSITTRESEEPIKRTPKPKSVAPVQKRPQQHLIRINQATPEEWARLRGIGEVLSRRIVRFRDKMGGFANIDQVGQTYGLADSVFQQIRPQLRLSRPHRRWAVNELSAEELAEHPYISQRQAKALVSYREQSGSFRSLEAFQRLRVFSPEEHQRLAPYLDLSASTVHTSSRQTEQ